MLEPTEIGGVLGLSAMQANSMLCAAGLQVKTGAKYGKNATSDRNQRESSLIGIKIRSLI